MCAVDCFPVRMFDKEGDGMPLTETQTAAHMTDGRMQRPTNHLFSLIRKRKKQFRERIVS
jgi:hypothetical protein